MPSVATIARLLSSVGQVDAAPRKRPRSSYIPCARSTAMAMAMWQLDASEYRLANGPPATIYQVIDDATWTAAEISDSGPPLNWGYFRK